MNQARSGKFYAEDFEERRPIPWGVIFAMSVFGSIFIAGAAFYADHRGFERGRAFQSQLATPTCKPPPAPVELSRSECINACFSKDRMSRVKPRMG
jgi:hypothetical protein